MSEPESETEEINELEDVPGLGDWLDDHKDTAKDDGIFDDLDTTEFDELLESIESENDDLESTITSAVASESVTAQPDEHIEPQVIEQAEPEEDTNFQLDNPDLDLNALLSDLDDSEATTESNLPTEDFLDVEALIDDGEEETNPDDFELDLDVSLSDFTGVSDDDDVIDIDKDAGQHANLDLARMYIEMDDEDAARNLLDEVIRDGTEEQIKEAQDILNGIDN